MQISQAPPTSHSTYLAYKYMPELDGIRAISILGVITAHMHTEIWDWLSGGRGVILFFTLSGYLIARLCLQEETGSGKVLLKAFYARRAFRLLPAYYLVLAIYCLLIIGLGVTPEKRGLLVSALPYYVLYMSDIPGVLGVDGIRFDVPFSHSWSLGIEEKFYLVFPVLIFGLLSVRKKYRIPVISGLTLFFMGTPFFGLGAVSTLLHPYCNILVGCLIAFLLHDRTLFAYLERLGSNRWLFGLLAVFFLIHFAIQEQDSNVWSSFSAAMRSVYTVVFGLLLAAILLSRGRLKQALGWRPLAYIGRISYGIYLLHILCLNVVERVLRADAGSGLFLSLACYTLACAVSILCAAIMYALVERPCISAGQAWSKRIKERDQLKLMPVSSTPSQDVASVG